MNEQQLYELLGRKQAVIEQVTGDYAKLVAVLRGVKDGTISLDRLTVNADGTWALAAAEPK